MHVNVCTWMHACRRAYVCGSASQNIGVVTGPGGLFATRLVTESWGLATNPSCDEHIEDYSTLRRSPRQGFVTEGPRQRYITEGGEGTATNSYFESRPCMYACMYAHVYVCILYVCNNMYACIDGGKDGFMDPKATQPPIS